MNKPLLRVLVVDDERLSRVTAHEQLKEFGYISDTAEHAEHALEKLEENEFDVLVSDVRMPGMDGLDLLRTVKSKYPDMNVILITAFGTVETAVSAIKEGASDFLTKPFRFPELDFRLRKIQELMDTRKEISHLREVIDKTQTFYQLVGQSKKMEEVYESIRMFADNAVPVLIVGETGTGKEMVSRALHMQGSRAERPFIPVSCGAIPKDLAESELFGHEKGSFTGALQQRIGHFERADKGTLLLDDVDDLPLETQAKLLRVLQEGTISRIGGDKEIQIDVRLIATTKVDLNDAVEEKQFRKDLFYRLRGMEIHLPPLRNRKEDIPLLAHHFLHLPALGGEDNTQQISESAAKFLKLYNWPGNVRELRRVMESSSVLCHEAEIQPEHLPIYLREDDSRSASAASLVSLNLGECESVSFNDLTRQVEKELIQWALDKADGQQSQAADLLCLPRTTFQSKMGKGKK